MLISCPPTRNPCYYGIDFPSGGELIANKKTVDEIRDYLGLDSLYYLSLEGLLEACGGPPDGYCKACFDGIYPVEPDKEFCKLLLGTRNACQSTGKK